MRVRHSLAISVRIGVAVLGWGLASASAARASSFVTVAPPEKPLSRSIVVLGERAPAATASTPKPENAARSSGAFQRSALDRAPDWDWETPAATVLSRSVIAMGEPEVEAITVAAIAKPAQSRKIERFAMPTVIRGGIFGDAVPLAASAEPATPQPREASAKKKPSAPAREPPADAPKPPAAPPPSLPIPGRLE